MVFFPAELWIIILDHVSRSDLKSLRLVSIQVNRHASALLYSEIHLSSTRDSFSRAVNISSSPTVSHFVKTLIYHVHISRNEPYVFRPEKRKHFTQWFGRYNPDADTIADSYELQRHSQQGTEAYELHRILARLPSLTNINVRRLSEKYAPQSSSDVDCGWLPSNFVWQPVTGRSLLVLVLLAMTFPRSVTSFRCEYLEWAFFERMAVMWIPINPVLTALRSLHLEFTWMFDAWRTSTNENELAQFFQATPQLESLILDLGAYDVYDLHENAMEMGNAVLTCMTWRHLKTFSLVGFSFREQELLSFLLNHLTIRNLRLSYICVAAGNVNSMILDLQDHMRLGNLSFHGVYDDETFEAGTPPWLGSCISHANVTRELSSHHLLGEETNILCPGYRSEEWFGWDGSWKACDGSPVEEDLISKFASQGVHFDGKKPRRFPHL